MSQDAIVFCAAFVVLAFAAWSLRPQQSRAVSSRWFIGGKEDLFFQLLFNANGMPRKYAWCAPLLIALLLVAVMFWFLSDA